MKKVNDIIELGSGEKYIVESVTPGIGYNAIEAARLLRTGKASKSYFATLLEKDGQTRIIRRYKA